MNHKPHTFSWVSIAKCVPVSIFLMSIILPRELWVKIKSVKPFMAYVGTFSSPLGDVLPTLVDPCHLETEKGFTISR